VAGLHKRTDTVDPVESESDPVVDQAPEPVPAFALPVVDKPKPASKRRDTGTLVTDKPVEDPPPAVDPVVAYEDELPEETRQQPPPNVMLPVALILVAALLVGLGWWFMIQANKAAAGGDNGALTDVGGTSALAGDVKTAVSVVLSYKFDEMPKATASAKEYLSGEAVDQYDKSMQALSTEIQNQKLQVTVTPVSVGVVRLAGDDARVLVFADQFGVRADKQPAGGPTQFAVDMHRVDGKWKIVKLDFFDGK
jgi:Mce-associated membrane protein